MYIESDRERERRGKNRPPIISIVLEKISDIRKFVNLP